MDNTIINVTVTVNHAYVQFTVDKFLLIKTSLKWKNYMRIIVSQDYNIIIYVNVYYFMCFDE